jgi:ElaB/YqjD/DUF883 family membrane-anchored ribosome-binding protein
MRKKPNLGTDMKVGERHARLLQLEEDLASMTGERDALLERCREAVETIEALLSSNSTAKARTAAIEIRNRIAAAIEGGIAPIEERQHSPVRREKPR